MKKELKNYRAYKKNGAGWLSYVKWEGDTVYTYEPMNCREFKHAGYDNAVLFLRGEGYTLDSDLNEGAAIDGDLGYFSEN